MVESIIWTLLGALPVAFTLAVIDSTVFVQATKKDTRLKAG